MANSAELQQRREAAVPRGVSNATAIYAKRAKNAEIWSEDGKRYIDFGAGIAVVNTGHRHPRVMEAARQQLEKFTHTCFQVVAYEQHFLRLDAEFLGDRGKEFWPGLAPTHA